MRPGLVPQDLAAILARPIAHRGLHDASRGVIENSLAAARAAVAAGHGIECDVQLSSDGEAIVFHDDTLERLTSETGAVNERTAQALAAIALTGGRGDNIATLPAFLAAIAGRVPVVIEIKSRGGGDVRLARRCVDIAAAASGPVALKSFDTAVVACCRALAAPCPLGLVGPAEEDYALQQAAGPDFVASIDFFSWNIRDLAALRHLHPQAAVMSWTIRSVGDERLATSLNAQIIYESYQPE